MQKPTFDPGLTQQYGGPLHRVINPDGTFNVIRKGTDWRDVNPYLHLISIPWGRFLGTVLVGYIIVNTLFAIIYYLLGPGALHGPDASGRGIERFLQCLFFSSQTLTTVGFGAIAPSSRLANLIAALEALTGLLGFAVATGLLFGRVSSRRPRESVSARMR